MITIGTDGPATSLAGSLASESVDVSEEGNQITTNIIGRSASDLRAKFNSTVRSLLAASEALMSIR
jgi:tRNA threonylcarbamoyladenosine modification (KEOPS) complex  Pcc1 subunit